MIFGSIVCLQSLYSHGDNRVRADCVPGSSGVKRSRLESGKPFAEEGWEGTSATQYTRVLVREREGTNEKQREEWEGTFEGVDRGLAVDGLTETQNRSVAVLHPHAHNLHRSVSHNVRRHAPLFCELLHSHHLTLAAYLSDHLLGPRVLHGGGLGTI